jgi:hypothetical protein
VLHVAGRRRNRVDPALVCRPYRIRSRVKGSRKTRMEVGHASNT